MSTMRAVQVVGYHQNLQMAEVPVPTPTGPFDVVVKNQRDEVVCTYEESVLMRRRG